jgi:transposase
MRKFIKPQRNQLLMLQTVDLNSIAVPGSALHSIDTIVESLDTSAFEAVYDLKSSRGNNPIDPKTIIKVCLYALHNGRFSTRKMEYDTGHHLGYMFLTGAQRIDHSTFSKFLSKFKTEVVALFSQIVLVCVEQGLVDFKVLCIDSVKLRANASHKQQKNRNGLEKAAVKLRKRIEGLLDNVSSEETAGEQEQELRRLEKRLADLDAARDILNDRLEDSCRGKGLKEAAQLQEQTTVNITDPDAHIMQQANGEKNPAYSVTTAADSKADIIAHFQVNTEDHDSEALQPAIAGSAEKTGKAHEHTTADAGFGSIKNLEYLAEQNINALIPDRRLAVEQLGLTAKGSYDRSQFVYDALTDSYQCPAGNILNCCGMVTVNGRASRRYANPSACRHCQQVKNCTKAKQRVLIRDEHEAVRERMREKLQQEVNQEIYKVRAHTAEAPYGCIKRNWKFTHVLRRGITKVALEVALLFSLHNILKLGAVLHPV